MLPRHADGLVFDIEFDGRPVRYLYHVTGDGFGPKSVTVNGAPISARPALDNPYRVGGALIEVESFVDALDRSENLVEITV